MTKRLRLVSPGHETSLGPADGLPDDDEPRPRGRPRGSGRATVATHTVRLESHRQGELTRIAAAAGRSVHSLLLEGIERLNDLREVDSRADDVQLGRALVHCLVAKGQFEACPA